MFISSNHHCVIIMGDSLSAEDLGFEFTLCSELGIYVKFTLAANVAYRMKYLNSINSINPINIIIEINTVSPFAQIIISGY